jgi:hypothetical protein
MVDDESISLASIFGGIPDLNRDAHANFVDNNDFPDPKDIASTKYTEAYNAFKMQVAYLEIILENKNQLGLHQIAYNIHLCETARLALAKVSAEPAIAKAIQSFRQREEENLHSYETPLPILKV